MSVHYEQVFGVIRIYAPGKSYEKGSKPKAIGTVCRVSHGVAEVLASMGSLSRADMREIAGQLKEQGWRTLQVKRAAGHRVPKGTFIRTDGVFDFYEVNLEDV